MRHTTHLLGGLIFSCLLFSSCKKDLKPTGENTLQKAQAQSTISVADGAGNEMTLNVPDPSSLRYKKEEVFSDLVSQIFFPVAPTTCNPNTAIRTWLTQERAGWTPAITSLANQVSGFPFDYAYVFENNPATQTFGSHGEYNQIMAKTFKDLNRFWNMESVGIVLAGGHGNMLVDPVKISKLLVAYGNSQATSDFFGNYFANAVSSTPLLRNGDHPFFTFNAFASTPEDLTALGLGVLPYKIVMGDGIMQGYAAIGFDDVAPQAVLAHEYGHQVQYNNNVLFAGGSEGTRRTELMADALSAYFLSHARGASMQWKRVQQFLQVFFNIGDCAFTNPGHHGTPLQRMAAATWAYNVANDAQKQGKILSAQTFIAMFDAQLPTLVAGP